MFGFWYPQDIQVEMSRRQSTHQGLYLSDVSSSPPSHKPSVTVIKLLSPLEVSVPAHSCHCAFHSGVCAFVMMDIGVLPLKNRGLKGWAL